MAAADRVPPFKRFVMLRLAPPLGLGILNLLDRTWRYRVTGREHLEAALAGSSPTIVAFLHGRTFALLRHLVRECHGTWVSMCSKSLDGEAMARIEERLGLEVVRGSSGRDGLQALQEMVRRVRHTPVAGAALAVDGSRGPRGRVQGGIVRLARWTGGRILPVTASARPAKIFRRAWDRTMLPLPFARVDVVYGELLDVPASSDAHATEALRAGLEERMVALQAQADELSGHRDDEPLRVPI
ncbi:MAG: lysophospholipid acyltransferase family protein [Acidobacteriota bacterium]|nr:lysophospholipid acyltransferase family protein [Acidobacteriota bacterium]MDH3523981.1 lysophospholipid acyltransferase family protein [Acidobacteriota bacterium]